jgi:hypothetical protein
LTGTSAGGATRKDAQLQCVATPLHHEKVATVIIRTEWMMGADGNGHTKCHTTNGWAALQNFLFFIFSFLPKLRALGSRARLLNQHLFIADMNY